MSISNLRRLGKSVISFSAAMLTRFSDLGEALSYQIFCEQGKQRSIVFGQCRAWLAN
jgi:hypothetical protein